MTRHGRAARLPALLSLLLLTACQAQSPSQSHSQSPNATLVPEGAALEQDLPRYGLNLGGTGTWGAEHLRANILANPGFEPVLDRSILIVKEARRGLVVDDSDWVARPDGFWSGGSFDVRSGSAAGASGKVLESRRRAADRLTQVWLDPPIEGVRPGDVIALTREDPLLPAPNWRIGKGRAANTATERRPGSAGRQSARLLAVAGSPAELLQYFDNIGDRAGKLLPLGGRWRIAFWARANTPGAQLRIHLDRGGRPAFFDTVIQPESQWRHYEFEFEPNDSGPAGALTFALMASGGEILLDDAYLGEAQPDAGGFRPAVVATLKTLRPGYLRDWQGQLGDTLANRLAEADGHQPARYRPGGDDIQYHYSLPEFLTLCAEVGAQPWVVAPTTLNDEEWQQLGAWLRQAADRHGFREIMVEFGNENWNPLFRPGAIPDATTHGAVADRAFRLLRRGSHDDPRIHTVANAQFANPESPRQTGAASREADRIAVAPYFLYRLDAGTAIDTAISAAFGEDETLIRQEVETARQQGKRLAVYEENFHTTLGSADAATRNAVVAGAASGPALARRLLQGTLSGVREQAVYTLAGFDNYLQTSDRGLVRLWGITRDLASADRLRPTGLALQLLNRVAGGSAQAVRCTGAPCAGLTALAFGQGRRLAVVSARAEPSPVTFPCGQGPLQLALLDGSRSDRNNEREQQVRIDARLLTCQNGTVSFTLPAYSLAVLHP